jgi:hypothetical protein
VINIDHRHLLNTRSKTYILLNNNNNVCNRESQGPQGGYGGRVRDWFRTDTPSNRIPRLATWQGERMMMMVIMEIMVLESELGTDDLFGRQ